MANDIGFGRDFFRRISAECNFADPQHVKEVYYAMLRMTMKELKEYRKVIYPNWGKFYVITPIKPTVVNKHYITGLNYCGPIIDRLNFRPCDKLKAFIKGGL